MWSYALQTMFFALSGCRQATVVDGCDVSEEACLACSTSDECAFTGNECLETVYCAHVDAPINVIEIGCEDIAEYSWPDAENCACVEGYCSAP